MGFFLVQFLTGLASASALFLVAAGLTLVFGVTRIVNFAHGSLAMLGAYLAWALVGVLPAGPLGWWGGILVAALAVALFGLLVEVVVLRRVYGAPEIFQLATTFGLALLIEDLVRVLFGPADRLGPRPPGLAGTVILLGEPMPTYDLFLVFVGPAVLGLLWALARRTRFGVLVRAASEDREMAAALGVDERRLFSAVFALGAFLAGLGGALQLPRETLHLEMDLEVIVEVFLVTVLGGMGSIPGAFLAAVLIRELEAFGILLFPRITLVLAFLVMAVVLVVRPQGLLGETETGSGPDPRLLRPLRPAGSRARLATALLVGLLVLLPWLVPPYGLVLAADVMVFALYAASLHLLLGPAGLVSFGHAAYFGLGAYGAALAVDRLGLGTFPALALAVAAAALGALLFGAVARRLAGVYFAMLSLAFAAILWATAVQWDELTGGDDGILGVWPDPRLSPLVVWYELVLVLTVLALVLLRTLIFAPFGLALRAVRDHPVRAATLGLRPGALRVAVLAVAGALAGLAGGLHAFAKGSVFPDVLHVARSVEGLVAVLLGGLHGAGAGPVIGAAVFVLLEDWASRLPWWRTVVGGTILLVTVAMPEGITGGLARLAGRWRRRVREAEG